MLKNVMIYFQDQISPNSIEYERIVNILKAEDIIERYK